MVDWWWKHCDLYHVRNGSSGHHVSASWHLRHDLHVLTSPVHSYLTVGDGPASCFDERYVREIVLLFFVQ